MTADPQIVGKPFSTAEAKLTAKYAQANLKVSRLRKSVRASNVSSQVILKQSTCRPQNARTVRKSADPATPEQMKPRPDSASTTPAEQKVQ